MWHFCKLIRWAHLSRMRCTLALGPLSMVSQLFVRLRISNFHIVHLFTCYGPRFFQLRLLGVSFLLLLPLSCLFVRGEVFSSMIPWPPAGAMSVQTDTKIVRSYKNSHQWGVYSLRCFSRRVSRPTVPARSIWWQKIARCNGARFPGWTPCVFMFVF